MRDGLQFRGKLSTLRERHQFQRARRERKRQPNHSRPGSTARNCQANEPSPLFTPIHQTYVSPGMRGVVGVQEPLLTAGSTYVPVVASLSQSS